MHSFLKVESLGKTRCRKSWNQFKGYDTQKSALRQASIREKKDHCWEKINVKVPHQRSPYAMKFEDRSHEETDRQQRCDRSKAWNLARSIHKLKEKDKAAFYFPAEEWVLLAASTKEPEEREFVVDSGASMHMVSKKDHNSGELETMRDIKKSDDGDDGQRRGANKRRSDSVCQALDLFVKVMLLEKTPAVLCLGKLCEGFSHHWISGQKPHLIRNGKRIDCNVSNCVPFVVPGLSASSSSTTPSLTSPSSSSKDFVLDVNRYTENPVPE